MWISKKAWVIGNQHFTVLLSHNNLFTSEAFIVIGNVHLALFAMRSL